MSKKRSHETMVQQTPSLDQGIKITVQKNKACVTVVNWGHGPFAYERVKGGDLACIPCEFKVETKSDGEYWIGETLVDEDNEIFYRFLLKRNPLIKSHWHSLPTPAYKEALGLLDPSKKAVKGSNGKLILGVHYPNVQVYLRNYFQHEQGIVLKTSGDNDVQVHKRKRNRVSSPKFHIDDIQEEEYDNLNIIEQETNPNSFKDLDLPFDFIDTIQANFQGINVLEAFDALEDTYEFKSLDENTLCQAIDFSL